MDLREIDASLAKLAKELIASSSFLDFLFSLEGNMTEKNAERIISLYITQVGLAIGTDSARELGKYKNDFIKKGRGEFIHKNDNNNKIIGRIKLSNAEALIVSFLYFVCPSDSSECLFNKIFSF